METYDAIQSIQATMSRPLSSDLKKRNRTTPAEKALTGALALTCQYSHGAVARKLVAGSTESRASCRGPREFTRGRLRRGAPRDSGIRALCVRVPRSRRQVLKQASKLPPRHASPCTRCSTSSARSTRGIYRTRASTALVPFGLAHRTLLASVLDASRRRSRERSIGLRDHVTRRTQDRAARSKPAPAPRPGSPSTPPRVQSARDAPGNLGERSSGRTRCVSR